jgi:L-amino acid N-acyltransferase YncA
VSEGSRYHRRMHIRLVKPSDAEPIRAIYNVEVLGSTATFDLRPRTPEEQQEWMALHRGPHPAIVAVDEDEVILGFGSLSPFRERPAYATTVENSVYVHAESRGRGVGRALLEQLIVLAGQHGFHAVVARVGGGNEASIALHQACGFEMVGVEREIGRKFNHWLDVSVLQRLI